VTRFKRLVRVTTAIAALATSALAVWVVTTAVEGSSTGKLGKGTAAVVPIKVTFADGLTPGQSEPISFVIENNKPGARELTFTSLAVTTTSIPSQCAQFLQVATANGFWRAYLEGTGSPRTVAAGEVFSPDGMAAEYRLSLAEAAPQSCEEAALTVKVAAS